jgi:hypothetical protein
VWPHERQRLIDDLWALGLANLPSIGQFADRATADTALLGRDLEPWLPMLAVALWLQEVHGVTHVYIRLKALSTGYQHDRTFIATDQRTPLIVQAVHDLACDAKCDPVAFKTAEVVARVNALAAARDLVEEGASYLNVNSAGWALKSLRLQKADTHAQRGWTCTRAEAAALARAYGVLPAETPQESPAAQNAHSARNVENADTVAPEVPTSDAFGVSDVSDVLPGRSDVHLHNAPPQPNLTAISAWGAAQSERHAAIGELIAARKWSFPPPGAQP